MTKTFRSLTLFSLALAAVACTRDGDASGATGNSTSTSSRPADADVRRDVPLADPAPAPATKALARPPARQPAAPAVSPAPLPAAPSAPAPIPMPLTKTVLAGATVSATLQDSLSSLVNKSGEVVHAVVSENVMDATGRVAVPAGSIVALSIVKLEPGSDQVRPEGRLELSVMSVSINGTPYPLAASIGPIPHTMKGRGVTKDEAARVAGGAAIGAAIGQVIGKNTKSTVIGGAIGTVAGGAAAARYAYRDVVVSPGAAIVLTLTRSLVVAN